MSFDWTIQMPWLAACLVGDGCLARDPRRPTGNPTLSLAHAVADLGWLEFKCEMIRRELGLDDDQLQPGGVRADGMRQARLMSPVFRQACEELYDHGDRGANGRRYKQLLEWPSRNPENILRLFWVWYLDDGFMRPNGSMELACCQSELEMQGFADALKSAFRERHGIKINPRLQWRKPNKTIPGNEFGLKFSVYEAAQILPTYSDYLPTISCMQRKLTMPETPTGERRITKSQLACQGPVVITQEQSLAIDSMTNKELQAFIMTIGVGHPRKVNGRTPGSKAAYLAHVRQHTRIAP